MQAHFAPARENISARESPSRLSRSLSGVNRPRSSGALRQFPYHFSNSAFPYRERPHRSCASQLWIQYTHTSAIQNPGSRSLLRHHLPKPRPYMEMNRVAILTLCPTIHSLEGEGDCFAMPPPVPCKPCKPYKLVPTAQPPAAKKNTRRAIQHPTASSPLPTRTSVIHQKAAAPSTSSPHLHFLNLVNKERKKTTMTRMQPP